MLPQRLPEKVHRKEQQDDNPSPNTPDKLQVQLTVDQNTAPSLFTKEKRTSYKEFFKALTKDDVNCITMPR